MTSTTLDGTQPVRRPRRLRAVLVLLGIALAATALAVAPLGATSPASAAGVVSQCNGTFNAAAAQIECQVVIANTFDVATGIGSSVVTVAECAGAPAAAICGAPVVTSYDFLTTSVDQCNGSVNAGGGVVICAVLISNTITGAAPTAPATVNQCAGSGQGGGDSPLLCDGYATTTGATITQCNGSVNGGGAPTRVNCSVGPSTETAVLPVTVNQCNGSANGGGALMFCSVQLVNNGVEVVYTGPPLTTTVPPVFPSIGGIDLISDVTQLEPVANPVVTPGTPALPGVPAAGGSRPGAAAQAELAATGTEVMLPVLLALLTVAIGGAMTLVSLGRRRFRTLKA